MRKRDSFRMFTTERDAALLSLDRGKITAYCRKYSIPVPKNEENFWRGVHKAIANLESAPPERKEASRQWLKAHGSTPEIRLCYGAALQILSRPEPAPDMGGG